MSQQTESIVLGGGCFWCIEAIYQRVKGVTEVVSGYAGGTEPDPTYEQVSAHQTNHAEVVKVTFNPSMIKLDTILDIFWYVHDPTTPNRQGNDVGPQYRSIVLYGDDQQKKVAETALQRAQENWDEPIVTEIKPLQQFYRAEDYQQNYFNNNPQNMYCTLVINPKLQKFEKKFKEYLKSD